MRRTRVLGVLGGEGGRGGEHFCAIAAEEVGAGGPMVVGVVDGVGDGGSDGGEV